MPYRRALKHISRNAVIHPTVLSWFVGFSLHVATGLLAVLTHYSIMWALTLAGMAAVPASTAGFAGGAATRYLLSYYKVFSPTGSVPATMFRFLIALAAQMAANTFMLAFFLSNGLSVWEAQITTTVILTFTNYLVYRLWVFN
jgi:putative flippase GtrA